MTGFSQSGGYVLRGAELDGACYPIAQKITDQQMDGLSIKRVTFHGE